MRCPWALQTERSGLCPSGTFLPEMVVLWVDILHHLPQQIPEQTNLQVDFISDGFVKTIYLMEQVNSCNMSISPKNHNYALYSPFV